MPQRISTVLLLVVAFLATLGHGLHLLDPVHDHSLCQPSAYQSVPRGCCHDHECSDLPTANEHRRSNLTAPCYICQFLALLQLQADQTSVDQGTERICCRLSHSDNLAFVQTEHRLLTARGPPV